MIKAVNLRQGVVIIYNGQLHEVVEAQHYKPGKGGAFVRSKLRNMATGSMMSETLRPDETFEDAFIEQKQMQYLYRDAEGYCFMDEVTYEQVHVNEKTTAHAAEYLKENMSVTIRLHDGNVLAIEPPIHVILQITQTDPGFRGDTVSGATKPATLETGKVIKVPLFVEPDQFVKVDTRTGEYIERA